jgi:hypothetical protein
MYSLVIDQKTGNTYILLNVAALQVSSDFFLVFLAHLHTEVNQVLREPEQGLVEGLRKCYLTYNSKFGIPFLHMDDLTRGFFSMFVQNAKMQYAESRALLQAMDSRNLNQTERFIIHKLSLVFNKFSKRKFELIENVIEVIGSYVAIVFFVEITKHHEPIHKSLESKLGRWKHTLPNKLRNYPDVLAALETVERNFDSIRAVESFKTFSAIYADTLVNAFSVISPRYWRTQEVFELTEASYNYLEDIDGLYEGRLPFGAREEFLSLLERIFVKNDVFPIVPIIAGMALLQILQAEALHGSKLAYERALPYVYRLSKIVESGLPEIRKVNHGIPLGFQDGIIPLAAFSQLAWIFEDEVGRRSLRNEAERLANKHHVLSVTFGLRWISFLESQDYENLRDIYQSVSSTTDPKIRNEPSSVKAIWLLTASIFDRKNSSHYLDMAEDACIEVAIPPSHLYAGASGISASQALMLITGLLRRILDYERSLDPNLLSQTRIQALALSENRNANYPEQLLVLKTLLVYDLILDKGDDLLRLTGELRRLGRSSKDISALTDAIERYAIASGASETILAISQLMLNEIDPWNSIVSKFLRGNLPDLVADVKPEDRMALVEGDSDAYVFAEFCKKMRIKPIQFIPISGKDEASHLVLVSRIVACVIKNPMPFFLVLDGDVRKIGRETYASIRETLLSKNSGSEVVRLPRPCIEHYLLNARAIKVAFPEITLTVDEINSMMAASAEKDDKKKLIEVILFKGGIKSFYTSEVARKIAAAMSEEEVDPEVRKLLGEIDAFLQRRS